MADMADMADTATMAVRTIGIMATTVMVRAGVTDRSGGQIKKAMQACVAFFVSGLLNSAMELGEW
jgi:hypothetical protein